MTKIVIAFLPDRNGVRQLYHAYVEKENKGSYRLRYQIEDDEHWYTETVKKRFAKFIPTPIEIDKINKAMEEE